MSSFRSVLTLCALSLGCHTAPPARAPSPSPPAPSAALRSAYEERVPAGALQYRFRAARFSNLFYTVDCLAKAVHCARDAFEQLAAEELGGLDAEDRRALDEWRELRRLYRGRVAKGDAVDSPYPLPQSHAQIERRTRLAGYTARTLEEYRSLLGMLLDAQDAERARDILARFEPRFDRYWSNKAESALRSRVSQFAAAVGTPAMRTLVERITAFYAPQLPDGLELTFDLILRPAGNQSNAEQLAHVSLIEVEAEEPPSRALDVVLHELFHFYLSQVPEQSLAAQMQRFAQDPDPLAYVAQGTFDEGLASALGNGLVLEVLDAAEFAKLRARPRGMYSDELIDAMARAAIEPMRKLLEAGAMHVTDAEFQALWMQVARAAFPHGAPPQAFLRPYVAVYPPELEPAMETFDDAVRPSHSASDGTLDPAVSREMFAERPRWSRVLFVRPSDVPDLARWTHVLTPSAVRALRETARRERTFVYVEQPAGKPTVFVFVAADSEQLKALVGRFVALPSLRTGVLVK